MKFEKKKKKSEKEGRYKAHELRYVLGFELLLLGSDMTIDCMRPPSVLSCSIQSQAPPFLNGMSLWISCPVRAVNVHNDATREGTRFTHLFLGQPMESL